MTKSAAPSPVEAILSTQLQYQIRVTRQRMTWWIPLIFVSGTFFSVLGLIPSIARLRETGAPTIGFFVFALFSALFGLGVVRWLIWPHRLEPRIVPYFAREIGTYRGATMAAFLRGRALYQEIAALEQLADTLGVKPLSVFGFAYDHYGQDVRWHPVAEGLKTLEALQRGLGARHTNAEVARDLETLASVLRAAADRNIDFSLILRLHAKDSMQMVCTREDRQGSFW